MSPAVVQKLLHPGLTAVVRGAGQALYMIEMDKIEALEIRGPDS